MHLVKWFRKNMTKLMAIFVILIMIAFVMPTVLQQLAKPRSRGLDSAMWLYGKDKKITANDMRQAATELGVLRSLYVDKFFLGQQDLRLILMGQLIFPETVPAALLSDEIKKLSYQNQLSMSSSKIDDFFTQGRGRAEIFWIALRDEAKQAGCTVLPQRAGEILNMLIPQVTNNQLDAASLVRTVSSTNHMTDEQALAVFADALSVMTYARILCDAENVTEPQLENAFARNKDKINAEYVPIMAQEFADETAQPTEAQIKEQFEKYRNYTPGTISEDNPYGFGYRMGPRVSLDYMIVKLDDVKKLITMPSEEDVEEFYQHNLEKFTEKVRADANDPNSTLVEKQKSYAEVADMIKNGLYARKVNAEATKILSDAIEKVEADFESLDFEKAKAEDFKSKAGDYKTAAEETSKKYDVKIYAGRTALLGGEEIQSDQYLGALMMAGQSRTPTRLSRLALSVEPLGEDAGKLGPFEPGVPKMYVSFGPLADGAGNIMAMVRVVDAAGSAVPDSVELSYQKNLPEISGDEKAENKTFVLKDLVVKNWKRLQGQQIAKEKAREFAEMVKKQSWDAAMEKFNASYGKKDSNEPDRKPFAIQNWEGRSRISQADIEMTKLRTQGMAGTEGFVGQSIVYGKLIDAFYHKLDEMQAKNEKPPVIIDFEPTLTCYVIKSLTRDTNEVIIEDYEKARQELAYQQDFIDSQSMAIEHFLPDNIFKRLNLRVANEPNKPGEVAPAPVNSADTDGDDL